MMSNKKLLELAMHLDEIKIQQEPNIIEVWIEWPEDFVNTWIAVKYNASYFIDMPNWFGEWKFNEHFQEPELIGFENLGFAGSCMRFFSINPKEFSHLFDVEQFQNIKLYGGEYLSKKSPPSSIAFNIRELVRKRN